MEQEFKYIIKLEENELKMIQAALNLYCATLMNSTDIDQNAFDQLEKLVKLKALYDKVCGAGE